MADTHDTIDGLLAEFRGYLAGLPASYHFTVSCHDIRTMLDRLEAAHKRERGDAAKLREAAEFVAHIDDNGYTSHDVQCAIDKARAALAEPPRQCDVGTEEEQSERFRKFCSSHKYLGSDFSHVCKGFGKGRCPFFKNTTKGGEAK